MKSLKAIQRAAQKECDVWNKKYSIGTPVVLLKDGGENVSTKTRSEAEVLSGHSAVIWLEGVSGCYLLERVTPDHRKISEPTGAEA